MAENITARVGRIISGSLNALVDAVEGAAPDIVMEQAIREIDGAIDDVRAELGKVVATKHLANQRLMDENRRHEQLAENIELAVRESRDDLAEAAIARQLDIEAQIPVLESTIADRGVQEKELEGYISALQAKKREMNEELAQFRASQQEAAAIATSSIDPATPDSTANIQARVEKAESAFSRIQERTGGVAGSTLPNRADAAKLAELDDLARKNRIQERLTAIKSKRTD